MPGSHDNVVAYPATSDTGSDIIEIWKLPPVYLDTLTAVIFSKIYTRVASTGMLSIFLTHLSVNTNSLLNVNLRKYFTAVFATYDQELSHLA